MKSEDTSVVIKEKTETETGNVKFKMLKKERVTRVSIKTVIFINLKYLLKEYNQLPVIQLQVSVRKCYFLALIVNSRIWSLKERFTWHHFLAQKQENQGNTPFMFLNINSCNAAAIHVGMNDLLSNIMSINEIYTI